MRAVVWTCALSGNSLISSRNSRAAGGFDEFAGVTFGGPGERALFVADRIDSTRLSGIAPQLTATNGFAARSPVP